MIIIKQQNGNVAFLNENEFVRIEYRSAEGLVVTEPKGYQPVPLSAQLNDFTHVESVEYVNEAQPAKYTFKAMPQMGEYSEELVRDALYEELNRMDIAVREEKREKHPGWKFVQKGGVACRFMNVCNAHDIETVGQLLAVGRNEFERYKNMGPKAMRVISQALKNLYDIDF